MQAAWLCLGLFLIAGCAGGPVRDTGATVAQVNAETYQVAIVGLHGEVIPGSNMTITVRITGSPVVSSDHIGAHFGKTSTTEPSTAVYTLKCNHVSGLMSSDKTISCPIPGETGTYYIRAHAAVDQGGQTYNYWGEELSFQVGKANP